MFVDYAKFRTKFYLHEFLQQECFLADAQGRELFFGNDRGLLTGGDMDDSSNTQDLVIGPSVRETASEDGAVLLDIEQGICFSLNPIGLKIWELLKTHHSVDEIADELAQSFPVSRSQLLSDVVEFLQSLEAKRLIHRADEAVAKQSWVRRIFPWAKERVQLH
ncbi:MAG TPA: PqqD family protein [Terriglobales bacterium]|nr:PqqD family protein [Terriglobales bacterium]